MGASLYHVMLLQITLSSVESITKVDFPNLVDISIGVPFSPIILYVNEPQGGSH